MGAPKLAPESARRLRENERKWGPKLVAAGWTLVPSTILERQLALGLDPVDLNILLHLARHWWQAGNPPRPSIKSIAQCIGKSVSTVQRRITRMKNDGLIEIEHRFHDRHRGQTSSNYYFKGLIDAATELAQETLDDRERSRKEAALKRTRKAPRRSGNGNLRVLKE